jgi:hypothetical protein
VELRIRHGVTGIEHDGRMFSVTADHWEPASYAKSMPSTEATFPSSPSDPPPEVPEPSPWLLLALFPAVAFPATPYFWELSDQLKMLLMLVLTVFTVSLYRRSLKTPPREQGKGTAKDKRAPEGKGGVPVSVEDMKVGGSGSKKAMGGVTVGTEVFRSRFVVNAAGGYADKISAMIGDTSFKIKPRLGDYLLLHRNQGHLARHTLFPCPGPLGKGVLVQTTLWGNLILGPTARDVHDPKMASMSADEVQTYILSK